MQEKNLINSNQKEGGQALITLLFFVIIAITITSASVVVLIANSTSATKYEEGIRAFYVAEGGAENAVLRLLRDPTYTGETLTISDGTATISVSGSGPFTITSKGVVGNFTRTVQVSAAYVNNILSITSWKEI